MYWYNLSVAPEPHTVTFALDNDTRPALNATFTVKNRLASCQSLLTLLVWIHTFQRADGTYRQFLNLEKYDQVAVFEIIRRLDLDNDELDKIPDPEIFQLEE